MLDTNRHQIHFLVQPRKEPSITDAPRDARQAPGRARPAAPRPGEGRDRAGDKAVAVTRGFWYIQRFPRASPSRGSRPEGGLPVAGWSPAPGEGQEAPPSAPDPRRQQGRAGSGRPRVRAADRGAASPSVMEDGT